MKPNRCWTDALMSVRPFAEARLQPTDGRVIEDTITLMVHWRNSDGSVGTALYTASWIAPKADCHTQQYFHYMGKDERNDPRVPSITSWPFACFLATTNASRQHHVHPSVC